MRISDWSSDVCSSDLRLPAALANALANLCVTLRQDVGNDKIGAKVREPERASTPYSAAAARDDSNLAGQTDTGLGHEVGSRSEERRVGKEWGSTCRSRWAQNH